MANRVDDSGKVMPALRGESFPWISNLVAEVSFHPGPRIDFTSKFESNFFPMSKAIKKSSVFFMIIPWCVFMTG